MPGSAYEFAYASLSETKIVAFTRDHDPQSIYTDPESATGPFGGLITSGVCTPSARGCLELSVPGSAGRSGYNHTCLNS